MGWPLTSGFKTFLGSTDVDKSALADGFIPYYHAASKKMKFRAATGTGDMEKATYDADNNGVVDNASALGGQAGSYYLDLANATGTLNIARIADASVTDAKLASSFLKLSGGTMTGAIAMGNNHVTGINRLTFAAGLAPYLSTNGFETLQWTSPTAGVTYPVVLADPNTGFLPNDYFPPTLPMVSGENLTGLNAANITKGGLLAWGNTDFLLVPSGSVGYATYSSGSITGLCAKSASASLQSFTWESNILPVPAGFAAFLATGGLVLNYAADTNSASNFKVTGITVAGWDGSIWANIYTDSTARTPGTANTVTTVTLNITGAPAVPTLLKVSISGQVANGNCGLPLNVIVKGAV